MNLLKPERYVDLWEASAEADKFVQAVARHWGQTLPGISTTCVVAPELARIGEVHCAWAHDKQALLACAMIIPSSTHFLMFTREFRVADPQSTLETERREAWQTVAEAKLKRLRPGMTQEDIATVQRFISSL